MTVSHPIDLFDCLLGTAVSLEQIQPGWKMCLHAKYPARNIFRWYTIRVDKNLLGEWCLSLSYGRIGHRGQLKQSFWNDLNLTSASTQNHSSKTAQCQKTYWMQL